MKDSSIPIQFDASGLLKVTISNEPGAIPLKDLTKTLEDYLNVHGGQGNLRIQIVYKDEDGVYKDWSPKSKDL